MFERQPKRTNLDFGGRLALTSTKSFDPVSRDNAKGVAQ